MEMNVEHEVFRSGNERPLENDALRAKSSLRLKYEAETEVIKRKLGDLEDIRSQLGLSQRKMAQLLLVDPSAWTRWTKGGETAPPHVYRMLQWYLAIEEKYPVLDVNFLLNTVAQIPDQSLRPQMESKFQENESRMNEVTARLETLQVDFMNAVRREMDLRETRMHRTLTVALGTIAMTAATIVSAFAFYF